MAAATEFAGTDRFRIVRRLGAGGMGVVYEAEDGERGQRVALKTIRKYDPDTLYRLKREFRALAELDHPNLVALHELVVEGECFFTMELLEGTDFLGHVRPHSSTPEGAVAHAITEAGKGPAARARSASPQTEIALEETLSPSPGLARCDEARLRAALPQLVQGLMALHATERIHRDVKPSNILVTPEGRVVLVDFGLVTRSDEVEPDSTAGHLVGTVPYMAPEQCSGETRLSPAADWYAVGAVLYEALTGRVPFLGPMMRVLLDKQRHPPAPPRAIVPGVAADLDALCVDLLSLAPEERPGGPAILRRLGIEPTEADGARSTARSGTRTAPFAGRDFELARLEQALTTTTGGQASVLLLRGPSGIGKSTLVARFLDRARARHRELVALQGRCYERETVPYQAMDSLIDHLSRHLRQLPAQDAAALLPREAALMSRLFPVLDRVPCIAGAPRGRAIADPQELRTRAFAALRELLQRLAERHPLVLVLDDLQWVDGNTLTVLSDLMRPPDPPLVCLVLSCRPEGSQPIEALIRRMGTEAGPLELAPLGERAATELASELLGPGAADLAGSVAHEAAGNPFFIGELVQYVQTTGKGSLGGVRLDDVIGERLAQLSEAGRRILELASLAGEPITRRALGAAAGVSSAELAKEADALRTLHFIRGAGTRGEDLLEPFHDRVRDAVSRGLSEEVRRGHFLALARASGGEVSEEQRARYWLGAGEPERAAEHARRAADEAAGRLDFDRAAGLYQLILASASHSSEGRWEILDRLGAALANAGRPLEAARVFAQAAEGREEATRIDLQRRSAEQFLRGGYLDEGLVAVKVVLAEFDLRLAKTPFHALLSALFLRAWLRLRGFWWRKRKLSEIRPRDLLRQDVMSSLATGLGMVDTMRGLEYQARSLLQALRTGEPHRLLISFAWEAANLANLGNHRRAQLMLQKARSLLQPQPEQRAWLAAATGATHYFSGAWRSALDDFTSAERTFLDEVRAGWEVDNSRLWKCFSLLYLGELAELARRVPGYVQEAERLGDRYSSVCQRTRLNIVWLVEDNPGGAAEDLEAAIASWLPEERGFLAQHFYALMGRGEIALYQGRDYLDQVRGKLRAFRRALLHRVPLVNAEVLHLLGRTALARAATDRSARARWLAEVHALVRQLRRQREPLAHNLARLLEAGASFAEGNLPRTVAALRRALADLEASETMLYASAARRRLGETLGALAAGSPGLAGDEGAALIAQADAWYGKQGVKNPARMTAMLVPGWPHPDWPHPDWPHPDRPPPAPRST